MSDHIELHDSKIVITVARNAIRIQFCPAYVHHWERLSNGWVGEGRTQEAELVIAEGSFPSSSSNGSFEVSDGWFQVGSQRHQNLIPVPIEESLPVRARLELVNAEPIELLGKGILIRLLGAPQSVEALPAEWAPAGNGQETESDNRWRL